MSLVRTRKVAKYFSSWFFNLLKGFISPYLSFFAVGILQLLLLPAKAEAFYNWGLQFSITALSVFSYGQTTNFLNEIFPLSSSLEEIVSNKEIKTESLLFFLLLLIFLSLNIFSTCVRYINVVRAEICLSPLAKEEQAKF